MRAEYNGMYWLTTHLAMVGNQYLGMQAYSLVTITLIRNVPSISKVKDMCIKSTQLSLFVLNII